MDAEQWAARAAHLRQERRALAAEVLNTLDGGAGCLESLERAMHALDRDAPKIDAALHILELTIESLAALKDSAASAK